MALPNEGRATRVFQNALPSFYQSHTLKEKSGAEMAPQWSSFGTVFMSTGWPPPQRKRDRFQNGSTFDMVVPFFTLFFGRTAPQWSRAIIIAREGVLK